jgi:hypothetical protein
LQATRNDNPPRDAEFEMTVFGPGVGECIVLHLGNGDWIIVDSCVLPGRTRPVALEYLSSIGVDPVAGVRALVATHWHDDHIQGIAEVLRECTNARFVMSAALESQQFYQLVLEVNAQNRLVKHNSSASEFADIIEILESRAAAEYVVGADMYVSDGHRVFHGGHGSVVDVWALSPSATTITNAMAGLADRLLTGGDCRRFKHFGANDLSVAILVQAGGYELLLGADLENTAAPHFGWKAVLNSATRPKTRANAFKIAHHGSANADHNDIWLSMLIDKPASVVTPYAKLAEPLPRDSDLRRIKTRTNALFCTTWPPSRKPPKRRGVDGIISSATRNRRAINSDTGHVRLRVDLNDRSARPTIELFGSAKRL